MTIEAEVAALTTATTALTTAVNVSKATLDAAVDTATAQAAAALDSENAAATSETNSTNSANLAASAVLSSLDSLLTQTQAARDAAIAGLGASDQSPNLTVLTAGLQMAFDLLAQVTRNDNYVTTAQDSINQSLYLSGLQVALDLIGVVARRVGGGDVQLGTGSDAEPSLWAAGDRNTGIRFPAADTMSGITGGVERWRTDPNGYNGFNTSAPTGVMDVNSDKLRLRSAKTPASATASGNAGEFCWDATYFYQCTATNTWRRVAHASW